MACGSNHSLKLYIKLHVMDMGILIIIIGVVYIIVLFKLVIPLTFGLVKISIMMLIQFKKEDLIMTRTKLLRIILESLAIGVLFCIPLVLFLHSLLFE